MGQCQSCQRHLAAQNPLPAAEEPAAMEGWSPSSTSSARLSTPRRRRPSLDEIEEEPEHFHHDPSDLEMAEDITPPRRTQARFGGSPSWRPDPPQEEDGEHVPDPPALFRLGRTPHSTTSRSSWKKENGDEDMLALSSPQTNGSRKKKKHHGLSPKMDFQPGLTALPEQGSTDRTEDDDLEEEEDDYHHHGEEEKKDDSYQKRPLAAKTEVTPLTCASSTTSLSSAAITPSPPTGMLFDQSQDDHTFLLTQAHFLHHTAATTNTSSSNSAWLKTEAPLTTLSSQGTATVVTPDASQPGADETDAASVQSQGSERSLKSSGSQRSQQSGGRLRKFLQVAASPRSLGLPRRTKKNRKAKGGAALAGETIPLGALSVQPTGLQNRFTPLMEVIQPCLDTAIVEEEDPEAPSDEEDFHEEVQRHENEVEPGRLVPVKLKWAAACTTSPTSIQTRDLFPGSAELPPIPQAGSSLHPQQLSHFQKLKIRAELAERQQKRLHRVKKLEDRVSDVQGYRQLWKEYQRIREQADNSSCSGSLREESDAESVKEQSSVRDDDGGAFPHLPRKDSFDLKKTESWYFDFQSEELDLPHRIKGREGEDDDDDDNDSQANLSLLSECSMEAQRRFYAEKRREQHAKKSGKVKESVRLVDKTPLKSNNSQRSMDYGPVRVPSTRSLSNMEVQFASPDTTLPDDGSLISDLAEDQSDASSLHNFHDYRMSRRSWRQSTTASRDDGSVDGSSIQSDFSNNDYNVVRRSRRLQDSSTVGVSPIIEEMASKLSPTDSHIPDASDSLTSSKEKVKNEQGTDSIRIPPEIDQLQLLKRFNEVEAVSSGNNSKIELSRVPHQRKLVADVSEGDSSNRLNTAQVEKLDALEPAISSCEVNTLVNGGKLTRAPKGGARAGEKSSNDEKSSRPIQLFRASPSVATMSTEEFLRISEDNALMRAAYYRHAPASAVDTYCPQGDSSILGLTPDRLDDDGATAEGSTDHIGSDSDISSVEGDDIFDGQQEVIYGLSDLNDDEDWDPEATLASLLLADQVNAQVKEVLSNYRNGIHSELQGSVPFSNLDNTRGTTEQE